MGKATPQSTLPVTDKTTHIVSESEDVVPIEDFALDKRIENSLRAMGVSALFPIQKTVIPSILGHGLIGNFPRDICVCAPTGSGKTLTYAIPIVQKLSTRVIPRVRALVLLPTRDLSMQVKEVFDKLCSAVGLKVAICTGQSSFADEQVILVGGKNERHLCGGKSLVDIVIATPGRLIDHINQTDNFTLQHLEFMVIDETDRLLRQSYQDWVEKVINACRNPKEGSFIVEDEQLQDIDACTTRALKTLTRRSQSTEQPLRKLLFSATLTRNPEKIASLELSYPVVFTYNADGRYTIPSELKQHLIVCDGAEKPLVILHLLKRFGEEPAVCFTASVEATHRLFRLLQLFGGLRVAEFSGNLPQSARTEILNQMKNGELQLLICSDVMARGIDVLELKNVINYDVPVFAKTYIHRIGRTARAKQAGSTFTICKRNEVRHFKDMLKKVENSTLIPIKISPEDLEKHSKGYEKTLGKLRDQLNVEKRTKASAKLETASTVPQLKKQKIRQAEDDELLVALEGRFR